LLGGLLGGSGPAANILEPVSSLTDAIEPIAASVVHAVSDITAPVTDLLAGAGASSGSGSPLAAVPDVVVGLGHVVAPLVTEVVTPITSLLDHGTGGAASPVTNILHGLLG
jgi:hypothetical protein